MHPLAATIMMNTKKSNLGFEDDQIIVIQSNHKDRSLASNIKKFGESRQKKKVSKSPSCSNNFSNCDENYLDSNVEYHSRGTKDDDRLILSIGTNSHPSL
jgi:hypothetical protein